MLVFAVTLAFSPLTDARMWSWSRTGMRHAMLRYWSIRLLKVLWAA